MDVDPKRTPRADIIDMRSRGRSHREEPQERTPIMEMKEITSALDNVVLPPAEGGVPLHVWKLLQQAGEAAAVRLQEIIAAPSFAKYPPGVQKSFIELALTRAYGLPVRKALQITLSGNDKDAVAASLKDLMGLLPEMRTTYMDADKVVDAEVSPEGS